MRSFLPDGPVSCTSNFMAGDPVVDAGLLVSNGMVGETPGQKTAGRRISPNNSSARELRRWRRHRRRGLSLDLRRKNALRMRNAEAVRRATWCGFRREENPARREYGGKGPRWFLCQGWVPPRGRGGGGRRCL